MTQTLLRWLGTAFVVLTLLTGALAAQEDLDLPDYEAWAKVAANAEQSLSEGRASDSALEALRATVAQWRETFLTAQDTNAARIQTLTQQIATLGAAPDEGAIEDPDIAARRGELEEQLAQIRAPVLRAEEAYTRADGLISEVDRIIRERQANALIELGPSPLNPAHWNDALGDIRTSIRRSWSELKTNATSRIYQAEARRNLPSIILLVAIGLTLVIRGPHWSRRAGQALMAGAKRSAAVLQFLVSLGQVVLPMLGIFALARALDATGFFGTRWDLLMQQVPYWAFLVLGIHWLAEQSFHEDDRIATLPLYPEDRRLARRLCDLLAWVFVIKDVLDSLRALDDYSTQTYAVLYFPLLVLAGILLYRLGMVRNDAAMAGTAAARGEDAGMFRLRFARLLGRAAMIIGVAGPVLAAVGFTNVGHAMVYPFVATLALVGFLLILQRLVNDLYAMVSGHHADEDESLLPVLAGFLITLSSAPVLALIWGARVADLTELWTTFREGFTIGETRISPTDFLAVVLVFMLGYMITRLLQGAFRSSILPKTRIDRGGQNAIVSGMGYVGIFVSALVAISAGGLDLSSLAIVAGALSVGIGFGLQNIVSNFVSGIILLIERPISEGDWIEVNGTHGIVKDISVRSTRMETFDKFDVIIPNADFVSGTVSNYTRGNSLGRVIISVGAAYGSNSRQVEKILYEIARENDKVLMNPEPYVFFKGFGADSLDFEIRCILGDVGTGLSVRTEMHHRIYERFTEEGIEIPFAQRDVWLRNPETLQAAPQSAGGAVHDDTSDPAKDPTSDKDDMGKT